MLIRDPIINHLGRSEDVTHQRAFLNPRSQWRINVIRYPVWSAICVAIVLYFA
jgi:hypothetical protein